MGQFISTPSESLTTLRRRRDANMVKRANSQEALWKKITELLSSKQIRSNVASTLHDLGVTPQTKLKAITSDAVWAKATQNGLYPYLIIGENSSCMLCGTKNGIANRMLYSIGKIPTDKDIYEDKEHVTTLMVAFLIDEAN